MILINKIQDGFQIILIEKMWSWWVYPEDHEISNNGERYKQKYTPRLAPFINLPFNWNMGDVINEILRISSVHEK